MGLDVKIKNRIRKIYRYILGTVCLSSVAFIFQACYGTVEDFYEPDFVYATGTVLSNGNIPIAHINVSLDGDSKNSTYTNIDGDFILYLEMRDNYLLHFEDQDSIPTSLNQRNVFYLAKDTVISRDSNSNKISFRIILNEK